MRARSRSTERPPTTGASRSATRSAWLRWARHGGSESPGSPSSARWTRSAARRSRCSTSRPLSSSSTRRASSTRSRSWRSQACRRPSWSGRSDRCCPPPPRSRALPRTLRRARRRRQGARYPRVLPARLRRDRALRRRLRDREHTGDHGRAADARARDTEDDRRLAGRCSGRSCSRRSSSASSRPWRDCFSGSGSSVLERVVRRGRDRPAGERNRPRGPHRRGEPRRRRRGHAVGEPPACSARPGCRRSRRYARLRHAALSSPAMRRWPRSPSRRSELPVSSTGSSLPTSRLFAGWPRWAPGPCCSSWALR